MFLRLWVRAPRIWMNLDDTEGLAGKTPTIRRWPGKVRPQVLARLRGFWAYFFPIDVTFSLSSIYEIIEWKAAAVAAPELGLAFLGTQGDIWDAQKDMLLAGTGAILAMVIVFLLNLWLNPYTWTEMRESFRLSTTDRPLGEEKIEQWMKDNQREKDSQ